MMIPRGSRARLIDRLNTFFLLNLGIKYNGLMCFDLTKFLDFFFKNKHLSNDKFLSISF